MPNTAPNDAGIAPRPPDRAALPSGGPEPEAADTVSNPAPNGALFRALVDAGADPKVAYTADRGMQTVVAAAVAAELQPFLLEMRQDSAAHKERLAAFERRTDEIARKTDEFARKTDELARRTDELEQRTDEIGRKTDEFARKTDEFARRTDALVAEFQAMREVMDARFDGIRRELRLIWGALGVLLTVQLAILGYLIAN